MNDVMMCDVNVNVCVICVMCVMMMNVMMMMCGMCGGVCDVME